MFTCVRTNFLGYGIETKDVKVGKKGRLRTPIGMQKNNPQISSRPSSTMLSLGRRWRPSMWNRAAMNEFFASELRNSRQWVWKIRKHKMIVEFSNEQFLRTIIVLILFFGFVADDFLLEFVLSEDLHHAVNLLAQTEESSIRILPKCSIERVLNLFGKNVFFRQDADLAHHVEVIGVTRVIIHYLVRRVLYFQVTFVLW